MSKSIIDEIEAQLEAVKLRPQTIGLIVEKERLAALCRYVRAVEAFNPTPDGLTWEEIEPLNAELQSARRDLGIKE